MKLGTKLACVSGDWEGHYGLVRKDFLCTSGYLLVSCPFLSAHGILCFSPCVSYIGKNTLSFQLHTEIVQHMAVSNTDNYNFQFLRKTAKALQREVKKSLLKI